MSCLSLSLDSSGFFFARWPDDEFDPDGRLAKAAHVGFSFSQLYHLKRQQLPFPLSVPTWICTTNYDKSNKRVLLIHLNYSLSSGVDKLRYSRRLDSARSRPSLDARTPSLLFFFHFSRTTREDTDCVYRRNGSSLSILKIDTPPGEGEDILPHSFFFFFSVTFVCAFYSLCVLFLFSVRSSQIVNDEKA